LSEGSVECSGSGEEDERKKTKSKTTWKVHLERKKKATVPLKRTTTVAVVEESCATI
jgi:hypothetical protein